MLKSKITKSLLLISTILTSSIFAQETLCYKENLSSISQIEKVTLDGGLCSGTKSIKDMQQDSWIIDDIKINPKDGKYSFVYIFKKENKKTEVITEAIITEAVSSNLSLDARIKKAIKKDRVEVKKQKEKEIKISNFESGKKLYINKCQRCHGIKADEIAQNVSRKLNTMTYQEMKNSIVGYQFSDYDNGRAVIMKPYSDISDTDIKNVHAYIQTLKK